MVRWGWGANGERGAGHQTHRVTEKLGEEKSEPALNTGLALTSGPLPRLTHQHLDCQEGPPQAEKPLTLGPGRAMTHSDMLSVTVFPTDERNMEPS